MRCALNTGPDFHLLDHIGPFAYSMKMPIYIEEEKNFTLSKHYYPMLESIHFPEIATNLGFFAKNFDELYECKFWLPHLKLLFKNLYQKEMKLIFCAHGQSDKGFSSPLLQPYSTQDTCMIYGPLLKEMLEELNIPAKCKYTGNYRLAFYEQHKQFYDALAKNEIFARFPSQQFTLLYAPTWLDADNSTSFFQSITTLCEKLPNSINLIVKVHPLLEMRNPAHYYALPNLIEKKPNRILITDFPLVYPLLARADAYLGDYSSVGYDFLYFQKPMFFLLNKQLPLGKIHKCGVILERIEDLFSMLDQNRYRESQMALYQSAFNHLEEEGQTMLLNHSSYR